ncbi:RNA polymerase sigma factor [Ktedonospora formicarum]|uniref:RNA polymerase sigma factor n=1 Tax=Ktedonospora formicarum TaxID=2778364 RepID=A0A8J3MRY9_9CHLR|nr:RNA polymerase sigma factor [Ktedonospora formicarum]GHO46572.1 RNA polymerase sigma factor [Ktedonospora formicarum]
MSYLIEDRTFSGANQKVEAPTDDAEMEILVVQAQRGNIRAFEALYERYNSQICRYLSRMVGNDGIGCELTQETFVKVWSSLPGLRSPVSFVGWLYRIATNCAYTYQKKYAKRQKEISLENYLEQASEPYVEGPEKRVEDIELLRAALVKVSPTYRPCLILYLIEDLPQSKIATLLDMKETSVSKYVSRGLEDLRQIYLKHEGSARPVRKGGKKR